MSEHGHKRKRILQDAPVDLSEIKMALNHLKEELDGIEKPEEESQDFWDHILALEGILKAAKRPRVTFSNATFSNVTAGDLKKAGVTRKLLVFEPAKVTELTKRLTPDAEAVIADLHSRIKKIYASVNMDYERNPHMILDAILLALADIASTQKRNVVILPDVRIAEGDGVQISHPVSKHELWLSGNVDYVAIEYEDVKDHKYRVLEARENAFSISQGLLFLAEAKRWSLDQTFASHIPEAVSQAIAVLKSANLKELRFCLSDGQTWTFFILKLTNGTPEYYESVIRHLSRDLVENSDLLLREIMQLICEWLRPTMNDLFTLE